MLDVADLASLSAVGDADSSTAAATVTAHLAAVVARYPKLSPQHQGHEPAVLRRPDCTWSTPGLHVALAPARCSLRLVATVSVVETETPAPDEGRVCA
jgi:hypothetical protein